MLKGQIETVYRILMYEFKMCRDCFDLPNRISIAKLIPLVRKSKLPESDIGILKLKESIIGGLAVSLS